MTFFGRHFFLRLFPCKMNFNGPVAILLILILLTFSGCDLTGSQKKSSIVWDKSFHVIGSQSSPRTADLNNDGTLDIVMGAGKNEFQQSDMGIVAFNGLSGDLLWKHE